MKTWALVLTLLSMAIPVGAQEKVEAKPPKPVDMLKNLQTIYFAFNDFRDKHGTYPPAKGGHQLSWRVHLLPYLGAKDLYEKFHLDEPWDSVHNKTLIAHMPKIYESATAGEKGTTRILGFAADSAPFGRDIGFSPMDITDGIANTLLVVQVGSDKAVPWTKPQDVSFQLEDPKAGLGELKGETFPAVFIDGHTCQLPTAIGDVLFRTLVTMNANDGIAFVEPCLKP